MWTGCVWMHGARLQGCRQTCVCVGVGTRGGGAAHAGARTCGDMGAWTDGFVDPEMGARVHACMHAYVCVCVYGQG